MPQYQSRLLTPLALAQDAHQAAVAPDQDAFNEQRDDHGDHGHRLQDERLVLQPQFYHLKKKQRKKMS